MSQLLKIFKYHWCKINNIYAKLFRWIVFCQIPHYQFEKIGLAKLRCSYDNSIFVTYLYYCPPLSLPVRIVVYSYYSSHGKRGIIMCQFGIIYYHFFQRRQTYIRQFFYSIGFTVFIYIFDDRLQLWPWLLWILELMLIYQILFSRKIKFIYIKRCIIFTIYALGAAGISRLEQFKYLIISDLQISPARFFYFCG